MSIRIMAEVWRTSLPTIEKMVLLIIADHASDDGSEAWPSQATIAAKASISIRTVQRSVNSLVTKGYLWMQKGAGGSATCRDDRRPHRYTIRLDKLRGDTVTTRQERGDSQSDNGATITPSTGRLSRPMNHPNEPSNETPVDVIKGKDEFDMFWNTYPLKVGKAAAKRAWEKAIKIEKVEVILIGAYRYANDPNRHPSFTAHASTWLNAGRWADAPLPERVKTLDEKKAEELAVSRAKEERERIERERWQAELREQEAKAVPMPDNFKQLLRELKSK